MINCIFLLVVYHLDTSDLYTNISFVDIATNFGVFIVTKNICFGSKGEFLWLFHVRAMLGHFCDEFQGLFLVKMIFANERCCFYRMLVYIKHNK